MAATCVTGDDTGLVKHVGLRQGVELRRWGVQAAGAGVCRLSWGPGDDEGLCGAGLQTGAVRFWDTGAEGADAASCEYAAPEDSPPAAIVGLRAVGTRVVACGADACVRVWQWSAPTVGGGAADAPLLSFQAGKRAAAADVADDGARLVTGGREADLSVWDLERGEASFKARNLPNDNLDLAVPIWTTDARFVPQLPNALVAATGFVQFRLRGEVRLYDVLAGRRPQARNMAQMGEEAISALGCTPDGRYVIAGSVSGGLCRLDLRKNLQSHSANRCETLSIYNGGTRQGLARVAPRRLHRRRRLPQAASGCPRLRPASANQPRVPRWPGIHIGPAFENRYKGAAGSVRQIAVHRSAGLVACAGLDRMVRVYNEKGGALQTKVYP